MYRANQLYVAKTSQHLQFRSKGVTTVDLRQLSEDSHLPRGLLLLCLGQKPDATYQLLDQDRASRQKYCKIHQHLRDQERSIGSDTNLILVGPAKPFVHPAGRGLFAGGT